MDYMAIARINGSIISWALRRSGAALESLATTKVSLAKLQSWVDGRDFPSEGAAEELADRLGIAYPMLYMATVPPDEPIKTPDLRTLSGEPLRKPSLGLLNVLDATRARQNWYRDELSGLGRQPLHFVSSANMDESPQLIAQNMRAVFGEEALNRNDLSSYEELLKSLVSRAEEIGILIMRSTIVGHATRKRLSVSEFRGFVLIDELAPIIFINDNDAKAAQIFTFAHELAHLWLGVSGVSDRDPEQKQNSANPIENKCDSIAAEFLIPETLLLGRWNTSMSLDWNLRNSVYHFKVSSLVVLRRAKELNLISDRTFFTEVHKHYDAYKKREREAAGKEAKKTTKRKGGNFYNSFEVRNGRKFNSAVVTAVKEQRTTYAEAGGLFGIAPGAAARYIERVAAK